MADSIPGEDTEFGDLSCNFVACLGANFGKQGSPGERQEAGHEH